MSSSDAHAAATADEETVEVMFDKTHVRNMAAYESMYKRSIANPEAFWDQEAKKNISWFRDYDRVFNGTFQIGDVRWFEGGKLNVSYNCIDKHLVSRGEQVAILWEGDDPSNVRRITYTELFYQVNRVANVLRSQGVRKGECVTIYMPMIPETAFVMLACARIGAPHSVVFAGFSAEALRDRIQDGKAVMVVTADEGLRGGKKIPLKRTVDQAVRGCSTVRSVLVQRHTGGHVPFDAGTDAWLNELVENAAPYCPPETMDSEDPLFYLYTSGSTGKPKGLVHTTGGYLVYTSATHRHVFDLHEGDTYCCAADVGWITGHSYIVYGPLNNGATTFMFEGVPTKPDVDRYWDMVERHRITIFYTSPTAIRALMRSGNEPVEKHDLSSLRVLGTVGEPINPEAWRWYFHVVGKGKCAVVDTYWQTETGGIVMTSLAGVSPMRPGCAGFPFFGIEPVVLDQHTGKELTGNGVSGVLAIKQPWPSMARSVYGNHQRYLNQYMRAYPGYYFTADGVVRDKDGFYRITGRTDDVLNVSGHRIGTAEVESALVAHEACSEAAVIGCTHAVKGEGIFVYATLLDTYEESDDLRAELREAVRRGIGPFASPDVIVITPVLPKTRSGKIMRRVLRKIANGEQDQLGDVSTLADPTVVETLIELVTAQRQ